MKQIMHGWFTGIVVLSSFLTTPAIGQQTPSAVAARSEPSAAPVDLDVPGRPLQELLPKLNVTYSPRLEAAEAIRGERLSIHVHHRPVSALKQDIQTLFNYDWVADADQPPICQYTLVLSERQRQYETDLWRQTLERGATRLFELTRYLDNSQEEYATLNAQLRQQDKEPADPMLRENLFYLSQSGPRLGLRLFTTLTPISA